MSEPVPQNLSNHVRYDPLFHFFALPAFVFCWFVRVALLVRYPGFVRLIDVLFVTAILVLCFRARQYALQAQDRVIRLEERLRLAMLLPDSLRPQITKLSEPQLIALRFASDQEVPGLVERTLSGNLSPADIKKSIQNWRADYYRV
jgi:hypothetical protein